jgi:hypothetical protein
MVSFRQGAGLACVTEIDLSAGRYALSEAMAIETEYEIHADGIQEIA